MTCDQDRRSEARQIIDRVLDGLHNDDDASRLNEILRSDPEISRYCMSYVELHGHLAWGDGIKIGGASVITAVAEGTAGCEGADSERAAMNGESAVTTVSGRIIPPIRHSSFAIRNALCFGSVPLAYVAIVLVFGAGLLGAWAWNTSGVTSPRAAVDGTPGAVSAIADPARLGVARITAMAGCRWEDLGATAVSPDAISAGNQFALKSGILEISYKSGAAVILQGPTNYEVESEEGGFLSAGKLTASIRPRRTGVQGSGSANGPSAFVLRTPTVTIVSEAGEIGVEVQRPQTLRVHVFAGTAKLLAKTVDSECLRVTQLAQSQSAEVEQSGHELVVGPIRGRDFASSFAHRIFRPAVPKKSFPEQMLAGAWLKSIGSEIGQQRLAAVGDGNDIELSPVPTPKHKAAGDNRPQHPSAVASPGVSGVTYLYRQTFEVPDVALPTALVRGAIRASGCVTAIRFNGQRVSRLSSDDRTVVDATWFTASGGLVERVNTLEIDVNGAVPSASEGGTMMWLRLWLTGIRLPGQIPPPKPGDRERHEPAARAK